VKREIDHGTPFARARREAASVSIRALKQPARALMRVTEGLNKTERSRARRVRDRRTVVPRPVARRLLIRNEYMRAP
jgi:hypothetical protein